MRRCVPVCVCQWEGGRWEYRRGCLSVLVDPAGDCSQIQLIPTGCFHLSGTSDEEKKKDRKKGESPEVQYLVCINLCPIPQETLVIISIPPSVRRTGSSAAFLWHVGLGNEKDKPWSLQTPPRGGDSRASHGSDEDDVTHTHRKWRVRCVASHLQVLMQLEI